MPLALLLAFLLPQGVAPRVAQAQVPEAPGDLLVVAHMLSYTPEEVAEAAGLPSSDYGAEAYRVVYLSRAPFYRPRLVTGVIIVPSGEVPPEGFPVVVQGHATTGLADECAPSTKPRKVEGLLPWIAYGYMVSASDYVGLGTPGLHPYLVGEAEGFSMLDAARAALNFTVPTRGSSGDGSGRITAPAANAIILQGHSQGGHAALFAHELWQSYAPELNLLGTVAYAPGSELRLMAQRVAEPWSPLLGMGASAMYAYSDYYGAPADPGEWLLEPYASEFADRIESQCAGPITLWLGFQPDDVFQPDLLAAIREGRWEDLQPWTGYMDANTPGNFASTVPLLILHGENDQIIPPEASQALMDRLCAEGTPVKLSLYPGVGHMQMAKLGRDEALLWIMDRIDGLPAPNECPGPYGSAYNNGTMGSGLANGFSAGR